MPTTPLREGVGWREVGDWEIHMTKTNPDASPLCYSQCLNWENRTLEFCCYSVKVYVFSVSLRMINNVKVIGFCILGREREEG